MINSSVGNLQEYLFRAVLFCSALISALSVLAIFGFLLYFAAPLFTTDHLAQLSSMHWRPFQGQYGILPMLVGSFFLAVSSLILAFPIALGICCFAHGIGPTKLSRLLMAVIEFMTSIPTVVYGFVSVFLLVPLLRQSFSQGTGYSLLAALLTLSILILPTIVLLIHSQLQIIGPDIELTAAALGMTPAQKILWVLLPVSFRGLLAAAVLGFGRAVGDTIIALMVAGNAPQMPESLHDSIRALTAHIALVVATDGPSLAYQSLFASGLILFAIALLVNLALRWIQRKAEHGGIRFYG